MHRVNVRKLYKTILRLHRALPEEMRVLGDQYVKDEFRRHKTIAKEYVAPFMVEWSVRTNNKRLCLKMKFIHYTLSMHLLNFVYGYL